MRSKFPIVRDHRVCRNSMATCIDRWRAGLPCTELCKQTFWRRGIFEEFGGITVHGHPSKKGSLSKKNSKVHTYVFFYRNDFIIPIHGENPHIYIILFNIWNIYIYISKGHHAHPPTKPTKRGSRTRSCPKTWIFCWRTWSVNTHDGSMVPWCIYVHEWLSFMGNVGKYIPYMDGMGYYFKYNTLPKSNSYRSEKWWQRGKPLVLRRVNTKFHSIGRPI